MWLRDDTHLPYIQRPASTPSTAQKVWTSGWFGGRKRWRSGLMPGCHPGTRIWGPLNSEGIGKEKEERKRKGK